MKVLILGVSGMLGHKLYQLLSKTLDTLGTIRSDYNAVSKYGFFDKSAIIPNIDIQNISCVEEVIKRVNPNIVINCIGIIKALENTYGRLSNIWINSLFPHQLYAICKPRKIRLIHISTDCVFSGKKGHYKEDDISDAEDIYGKTKYLGELNMDGALTIRTSIIGRELATSNNLVEWFMSNQGAKVQGFTNAIFSGFPTIYFANIMADVITKQPDLSGLYHISSESISKFTLLSLIRDKMGLDIEIEEYPDFYCDRSLDSTRYQHKTDFHSPNWDNLIDEFAEDSRQYLKWRGL
jgi:dTDP-4-dehydrorhamnose reductase